MTEINVALVDRVIAAAKARAAAKALAELGNNDDSLNQDNSLKDTERAQRRAERVARREQEEAIRVQKRAARIEKKQARLNELEQKRAERLVLREQRNSDNTSTKSNSLSDDEIEAAKKISEIMTQFGKDNIYRLVSAAKKLLRHGHVASLHNDVHSFSVGDVVTIVNWNGKLNGCEGVVKIISRTRAHVELNDRTVYLPIVNIVKNERQPHGGEDGTLTPIDDVDTIDD